MEQETKRDKQRGEVEGGWDVDVRFLTRAINNQHPAGVGWDVGAHSPAAGDVDQAGCPPHEPQLGRSDQLVAAPR